MRCRPRRWFGDRLRASAPRSESASVLRENNTGSTLRRLRTRRWIASLFEAGVVVAGLLMVLRYQYQVVSLAGYDLTLDLLFVGCVAGVLIVRRLDRPGGRGAVL